MRWFMLFSLFLIITLLVLQESEGRPWEDQDLDKNALLDPDQSDSDPRGSSDEKLRPRGTRGRGIIVIRKGKKIIIIIFNKKKVSEVP